MTHSALFRALLDEQDMPYEIQDFKTRKITYLECGLNGEPFEIEFHETPNGKRELTFSAIQNITAEEAFAVIDAIIDRV